MASVCWVSITCQALHQGHSRWEQCRYDGKIQRHLCESRNTIREPFKGESREILLGKKIALPKSLVLISPPFPILASQMDSSGEWGPSQSPRPIPEVLHDRTCLSLISHLLAFLGPACSMLWVCLVCCYVFSIWSHPGATASAQQKGG